MKKVYLFFLLICGLFGQTPLSAQLTDHLLGEMLIQLKPGTDAARWSSNWSEFAGRPTLFRIQDHISTPLYIWRFHFDHTQVNELRFLSTIRRDEAVIAAQFNHFIEPRTTIPDDPSFDRQWQYINPGGEEGVEDADLDMEQAWDIATGGITVDGDTIVVCVIDDGVDIDHEDLVENLWINHAEIPDNGIDDDLNGYIDDYRGWNIFQDNDDINPGGSHGTPVAGIIGAVGNNSLGVSGVNWAVKVMVVKNNNNTSEAALIEAYSYPLIQRMRYNTSNGTEGAFVVATNTSWGLDNGMAEDAPIWCGLYDSLGVHGILNCAATVNKNFDVEIQGDLPTTCPSDYLLSVTNLDRSDEKVTSAGFGTTSIDLGAYGENVYTITNSGGYGIFKGTSSATPHVAGAVALMYSAPCPTLMAITKSDPQAAALIIRQYLLDGVSPNASLQDITVTGGRLNVYNSMLLLMDGCQDCQPPTSVNPKNILDTSTDITWISNDSITRVDLRYRLAGTGNWNENLDVQSPFPLTDLLACAEYEFQIRTYCGEEVLPYSGSRFFKTDGCCEAPEAIRAQDLTGSSAVISWPAVLAADQYILRLREQGESDWTEITTAITTVPLNELDICTTYEYQLALNCSEERTATSPIMTFQTLDCGVCREGEYCSPGSYDASGEWIARVSIGTLDNRSGSDDGFGNFTGVEAPLLEQGDTYDIQLTAGFLAQSFGEYFRVWIDFNQDAIFSNSEIVLDPGMTTKDSLRGQISIPADALTGNTRMRVVMRFQNAVSPCSQFGGNVFGEVEDYCINIVPATDCDLPTVFDTVYVAGTEAQLTWHPAGGAVAYNVRYRRLNSFNWYDLSTTDTTATIKGLTPCVAYEAQIRTDCGETQSIYLGNLLINTPCVTSIQEPKAVSDWNVFPNPVRDELTVRWEQLELSSNNTGIQLLTPSGQVVINQTIATGLGRQQVKLSTADLPSGLYLLRLLDGRRVLATEKVVKVGR
jgi:hypothetical protein